MKKLLIAVTLLCTAVKSHGGENVNLTTDNTVSIRSSITDNSVAKAAKELINLDIKRADKKYPIYLVIDSGGGSILAGLKFIRIAKTIKNLKTICIYCASMAHAIAQQLPGERLAVGGNIMMAHRAKGGFSGQFESGEVESRLRLFKVLVRDMEKKNADRIGISLKDYKAKVVNEWWTYGAESLKQNIVDGIVELSCSKDLIDKKSKSIIQGIFGPIEGPEVSECPIML